jgi:hypothetical protein
LSSTIIEDNSKANPWLSAILAWLFPGAGHIWQGRVLRGFLLGAIVWALFIIGVLLGGHLYSVFESGAGLLSYVFGVCDLGTGLLYVTSRSLEIATQEQAKLPTSEYGNVFLTIAGLLNYLLILDAFDIGVGRKP